MMPEDRNIPEERFEKENLKAEEVNETIAQPETANTKSEIQKSEIENMEVHHHPRVEKKNFKEYFLEFLMIFLAVSLGFLADNLHENFTNMQIEKQNIIGLVKNLEEDTLRLNWYIQQNETNLKGIDSFLLLKRADMRDTSVEKKFYAYIYNYLSVVYYFISNDASIEQMKSSGSLRLIKDQAVADSILGYEFYYTIMKNNEEDCKFGYNKLVETGSKFLDVSVYRQQVISQTSPYHIDAIDAGQLPHLNVDTSLLKEFYYYAGVQFVSFNRYVFWLKIQLNYTSS